MRLPSVSVYITSYNNERYLKKCLDSALSQEYENLEVIVSDDASTDSSPDILQEYARRFPDVIKVRLNTTNQGSTANRNSAIMACTGEYIASLDGDDAFLPGKIRRQVEFMESHPECTISYHNCLVVDGRDEKVIYRWKDRFGGKQGGAETLVRYGNYMCSPTVMLRREHIPTDGLNPEFKVGADWIFFVQTLKHSSGKIGFLDEVLAMYHRHSQNITLDWESKFKSRLDTLDAIDRIYPELSTFSRKYRSDIYLMQTIKELGAHDSASALNSLVRAGKLAWPYPWNLLRLTLRELRFLLRHRLNPDDLVSSLLGKNNRNE